MKLLIKLLFYCMAVTASFTENVMGTEIDNEIIRAASGNFQEFEEKTSDKFYLKDNDDKLMVLLAGSQCSKIPIRIRDKSDSDDEKDSSDIMECCAGCFSLIGFLFMKI